MKMGHELGNGPRARPRPTTNDAGWWWYDAGCWMNPNTMSLCCYKPRPMMAYDGLWWPMMAYDGLWAHARVIIGHLAIWQHCSEPATLCSKDMATRVLLYAIVSLPRALLLIVRGGSPPDPLQALQRVYCIYVSYTYMYIYIYCLYIY